MADTIKKGLACPACRFRSSAEVRMARYRFLLFKCPVCGRNVVVYPGRVDTLSTALVRDLVAHGFLQPCGDIVSQGAITAGDIDRLHRLLASEQDFDRIVSQL